ncbi:MAG: adenylate/guanylate cyclase domain-containing protein [Lachnospiraceae bacterium]|nr:adenylate/guanylate cyclase domain-containing protein [Lachnospiraceae bacterium]
MTKKTILVSLIAGALTFLISLSGLFNRIDYMLTDALYQSPLVPDSNIKIIAIDEKSMNELGAYKTWSRDYYASLLKVLYEDEETAPAVTVFDLILQGNTDEKKDHQFAMEAKNAGGIVCATNMVFKDAIETNEAGEKYLNRLHTELIEYPYDELMEYSVTGFANTINDSTDSVIRDFFPTLSDGEKKVPSLALATAKVLEEKKLLTISIPDIEEKSSLMIRYTGKPGDYEVLSFSDVINGKIPKAAFKNSFIFVGAYAPGMMDAYNVPTSYSEQMYGVEIHANILESIANGRYMERTGVLIPSLVFAVVVFLFMLLAQNVSLLISGIIGLFLIALELFIGKMMSENHIYLSLVGFVICIILGYAGIIVIHYLKEIVQRRRVLKAFRQYVAPEVVESIAKKGNFELKLGGQKRDIAVLFVDIRGFTPLSEALGPEKVVEILNEYLTLTTTSIFNNYGTLDKFVGDATMAVFNSPFDLDDYVFKAVNAALDIVAGSSKIRQRALELAGCEVGFGVGVNCGDAVVGNIGCDFRMDYTAIGDTVNTAARLEANAKAGQVLVSQAVVDALEGRIEVEPVGEIPLKGKSIPLMVYELKGVK